MDYVEFEVDYVEFEVDYVEFEVDYVEFEVDYVEYELDQAQLERKKVQQSCLYKHFFLKPSYSWSLKVASIPKKKGKNFKEFMGPRLVLPYYVRKSAGPMYKEI